MNETYLTMCGYVATDPQTRHTRDQVPFVTFRLASTPRRLDVRTGEFVDASTSFVNVTAFRALAANIAESVTKGQPVIVHGRMRVNQWTGTDGRSGTSVEVEASSVGFDLARGRCTFERVVRTPASDPATPPANPPAAALPGAEPPARELVGAGTGGRAGAGTGGRAGAPTGDSGEAGRAG